ncbi:MAG: DinB family protein [Acidobacteriota bacterium]
MNRRNVMGTMIAAAAAVPLLRGADAEVDDWVGWWERSKKYTMAIAEAMPAESYSYVPFEGPRATGDGARSFGELMQHLAQAEGFYLGRLGKGTPPAAPRGDFTKATTVKYLNDVLDWSIGVVKQLTTADITKQIGGGKGPAMTGLDLLLNAMVHTGHTRGYSDMYLRNKGVKPPTYAV